MTEAIKPMRIVFVGTVEFSWHCLEEMLSLGANVVLAAYVDPEFAGSISDYRPLDDLCRDHGVPTLTFRRISDPETIAAIREAEPEVIFVLGLSQLLPEELLSLPPAGCIGSHPALLPENRGRALIPWSILLHHERGGLTLFYLTPEVDAGDVVAQGPWPITQGDTASSIYSKMIVTGRRLIRENLPAITAGAASRSPQDHGKATHLPRRTPADGEIDWTRPAEKIYDLVRATTRPYPGAFTHLGDRKLIIWRARLGKKTKAAPGEVASTDGTSVLVACGDGRGVWLDSVDLGEGDQDPSAADLNPGARLGRIS